ncbi:MAG: hypothetical protein LC713_03870 [Actinobacteria bacterium]|nr:hypothetical protein [Actinomycetota bacterium]
MAELTFAFAATLDGRVQRWSRHIVDHGPGRVVDTVAERRSALQSGYRILVVAADSRLGDADLVEQLQTEGRAVIAVWDPALPHTKEMALRLAADAMIDADASAEDFVRVALALAGELPDVEPVARAPIAAAPSAPRPVRVPPARRPGGAIRVALCGPSSDEATVVAAELARAAAVDEYTRVVLVDANELNPSVVQQLSLPVLPNLRIAVDAVRDRHHRHNVFDALIPANEGIFWVLGGLADPAQWADITPAEVAAVLDELADGCEVLITHGAPVAEDLPGQGGPDRFGITRRVLAEADRIVAVAGATPAGVAQLSGWMADVRLVAPATPIDVVLTRSPEDRFRRAELTQRVHADLSPASVALLPADPRVARAVWDGTLVARGPFRRGVDELAAAALANAPKAREARRG